jgi:hypothetical protein
MIYLMATGKLTFLSNRVVPLFSLPGSGWLIWYTVLVFAGLFNAYVYAVPAVAFLLGMMIFIIGPIAIAIFVIPPLFAIVISIKSLLRRSYQSAVAFGLVPIIGFGILVLSSKLAISIVMNAKIASYDSIIKTAVASRSNISEKDVEIDLGPPIVARFVQSTMMWDSWEIVYVEDDDIARFFFPRLQPSDPRTWYSFLLGSWRVLICERRVSSNYDVLRRVMPFEPRHRCAARELRQVGRVGKGVARPKAREPCPRAASLHRVGTARRGTAALAPLPTLPNF